MRPLVYSWPAIAGAAVLVAGAAAQTAGAGLLGLPPEVRAEVERVRKGCTELLASYAPKDEMQGVMLVKLGDRPAIVVDNLRLCTDHVPGANCTNRGCDVTIWQQDRSGAWQQC